MEYAVLDVESTGLYPGGHDRIIEVAVVRLAPDFQAKESFSTLINPQRDLGPSWLHGIRAADVTNAPLFEEIAGAISRSLRAAVLVGHNIRFDLRFLHGEFARMGFDIQLPRHIDTMSLAVRAGVASRRLPEACDLFGIELEAHHSALSDAQATAALFARCVHHFGEDRVYDWMEGKTATVSSSWPVIEVSRDPLPRSAAVEREVPGRRFLANLVAELPASTETPGEWQAYFAVLDRALEDRRISSEEERALRDVAASEGLSAQDLRAANVAYLRQVVKTAPIDDVISDIELADLLEVSQLLSLKSELEQFIDEAKNTSESDEPPGHSGAETALRGKTVCFTGALNASIDGERATREVASQIAADQGMKVVKSVTKKLGFLVMADPDSMSGKAKKARKYGIRILAESVFWSLTGTSTD